MISHMIGVLGEAHQADLRRQAGHQSCAGLSHSPRVRLRVTSESGRQTPLLRQRFDWALVELGLHLVATKTPQPRCPLSQ